MRQWMQLLEAAILPPYLYHATNTSNLDSIMEHGLLASRYGDVHGSMEYAPPEPCVYLSRNPRSNNLHADLFARGPVTVLKIDMAHLDPDRFYPDDAMGDAFAEEMILSSSASVKRALGCETDEARAIFDQMEMANSRNLMSILKPFWRWWLTHRIGGEVAYGGDVPVAAIVGQKALG